MKRNLSDSVCEIVWAELGNEPRLEVCANIADLCIWQRKPIPYWLRGMLQSSHESKRLFKAEMDSRWWRRYSFAGYPAHAGWKINSLVIAARETLIESAIQA